MMKAHPKSLKSAGELYIENINLLKKMNPIAFQNEQRKNQLYDTALKKKRDTKLVGQKNLGF